MSDEESTCYYCENMMTLNECILSSDRNAQDMTCDVCWIKGVWM